MGVVFIVHEQHSLEVWLQNSNFKAPCSLIGVVAMATTTTVPPGKCVATLASGCPLVPAQKKECPHPQQLMGHHGHSFGTLSHFLIYLSIFDLSSRNVRWRGEDGEGHGEEV